MLQEIVVDGGDVNRPVSAVLGDVPVMASPKTFKSGSRGWYFGGKVTLHGRRVQASVILTLIGTKPTPPPEQNGTMPKTALEGPPVDSPLFPDSEPKKTRRKRS